jgi:RND family efflux transporter MFP subunit
MRASNPAPARRRLLASAGLLSLVLFAAACDGASAAAPPPGAPPPAPVELVTLGQTQVRDTTDYVGILRSRRSITVQPQVDGQVTKILVAAGDQVVAGQPLIQIDPARQEASVTAAEATRASRLATLALARRELERTQNLVDRGAINGSALDQARSTVDAAQAEVDALGAQIRQNQVQLRYYRLTAPAKGIVGDIPVRVGDRVTPLTEITTIDDNGALEVYVSIPVERIEQVAVGTEVQLIDGAGAAVASGKVHFISPQVDAATQSVLVKAAFENQAGALRGEQFVRTRVVWSSAPGIVVPALSVMRMNGQAFVYAAEAAPGGLVARQTPVSLGDLEDNQFVVAGGLTAGSQIVASNLQKLRDGAPIVAAAPPPPPAPGAAPTATP